VAVSRNNNNHQKYKYLYLEYSDIGWRIVMWLNTPNHSQKDNAAAHKASNLIEPVTEYSNCKQL